MIRLESIGRLSVIASVNLTRRVIAEGHRNTETAAFTAAPLYARRACANARSRLRSAIPDRM